MKFFLEKNRDFVISKSENKMKFYEKIIIKSLKISILKSEIKSSN